MCCFVFTSNCFSWLKIFFIENALFGRIKWFERKRTAVLEKVDSFVVIKKLWIEKGHLQSTIYTAPHKPIHTKENLLRVIDARMNFKDSRPRTSCTSGWSAGNQLSQLITKSENGVYKSKPL